LKFLADERLLRHIEWTNTGLMVVVVLGAWVLFSLEIAFGVFLGGAIATVSFQVLKWQLKRALQSPGKAPHHKGLFISYYLRFLVTVFIVFTVIYYGWANPIALLVGLSLVVLSTAAVGAMEFLWMHVKKGGR
jgi:hypothetical protein